MNLLKRLWEIFTGEEFEDRVKACFYCHGELLNSDLAKHHCPRCGSFLKGEKVKGKRERDWRRSETDGILE